MNPRFGEIKQLGYIVRDVEKAMDYWINTMGVGPFYYVKRVVVDDFIHRGVPGKAPFAVAIANSGPLQVELIEPLDDAPSMWNEYLAAGNEGLQHVAYWTTEFDAVLEQMLAAGHNVGHRGTISGGRFVYFDTNSHGGTVIELSEQTGEKAAMFQAVRDAAVDWDGSDPIRVVGP